MIDFKSVLGTWLESDLAPSASQRMGHAVGAQQQAGGGLSSILGSLGGGQRGGDLGALLGGLLGSSDHTSDTKAGSTTARPMAVRGVGALAGALLGGRRSPPAQGVLGDQAIGVLGHIARQSLQRGGDAGRVSQALLAQVRLRQPMVAEVGDENSSAELLLRAMINAAKADGQIDGTEMNNILSRLDEAGAGQETKDFVLAEMRRPLDLDGLVARVRTPESAAAVYAASTMAITFHETSHSIYLTQLADRLRLRTEVVASLNSSLGVPEYMMFAVAADSRESADPSKALPQPTTGNTVAIKNLENLEDGSIDMKALRNLLPHSAITLCELPYVTLEQRNFRL